MISDGEQYTKTIMSLCFASKLLCGWQNALGKRVSRIMLVKYIQASLYSPPFLFQMIGIDYSTTEYKTDDFAPGVMNLDSLGLGLEADIYNEKTDTRAFVASNITSQVDGERDSIIVIAFRGTASSTNLKTDFNWGQEALPEHFIAGADGQTEFQMNITNTHGRDVEMGGKTKANHAQRESTLSKGLIQEADTILRSAPITRLAFPCVHSGFIQAYSLIRDEIIQKVIQVMERQINKALERCGDSGAPFVLPKIYVTGHSLGGSCK